MYPVPYFHDPADTASVALIALSQIFQGFQLRVNSTVFLLFFI